MMEEKRLVPKRRFKGYYKNWFELRLKDFREESDRYSYTGGPFGSDLKSIDYTETGIRIIQLQNIGDGFFSNSYKIYTSKEKAESLSSNLIFPDDIIIAKMAEPLARAAIIPNDESKYLMASDGIRLKVDKSKFNNYFILTLINHDNFRNKALENSTGTTRKRIGLVTLGNLGSYVPEFGEQQKIGKFFKILDERIANQERKIAKVKALKSAYLTEMFSQEGETVPKRRFKGFQSEWLRRKVGDIFQVTRGNVLSTTKIEKKQSKNSHYPVYSSQTQNDGLLGYYSAYLFDTAITWTTDGANAGTVNYREGKFYSTNVNGVLISNEGYACKAVAEILDLEAWKHVSKVGNPKLMNNVMSNIEILIPNNIKELEMLSLFFKNLDDQIATEEKKLQKLKKMKEAYLEEMFV
ncbi:restriction endonuclease subunit S [Oceanobacillus sp. HCA-5259]|uniref:restriction endonuclease subunit S n=1 Tax=Oceanobacillus sp. HCA-5259 TaxID=3134661 RepID=UPI0030BFB21B